MSVAIAVVVKVKVKVKVVVVAVAVVIAVVMERVVVAMAVFCRNVTPVQRPTPPRACGLSAQGARKHALRRGQPVETGQDVGAQILAGRSHGWWCHCSLRLLAPTAHLLRTQAACWAFTGGEECGSDRILLGVRQHNVRLLRATAAT